MSKKNTTSIELNGRRYDVLTGEVIEENAGSSKPSAAQLVISDIVTKSTPHHPQKTITSKKPTPVHTITVKSVGDIRHPHHTRAHQPQHASTLARQYVKKPAPSLKRHVKAVTRTDILAKSPAIAVLPKWSFHQIDPSRLVRAERVARSKLISRFAPLQFNPSVATDSGFVFSAPQPSDSAIPIAQASTVAQPIKNPSLDIFQRALEHATSHEQVYAQPKKRLRNSTKTRYSARRTAALATLALTVVLASGFVAYQARDSIILRFASAKAGFHAVLPSYLPTGYSTSRFSYSAGLVDVTYHNVGTNTSYTLVQKTSSSLNTPATLTSYVAANNDMYQTFQVGSSTVYIYGNNNASWIRNGILYQLNDDGNLSTSQALQIAKSL